MLTDVSKWHADYCDLTNSSLQAYHKSTSVDFEGINHFFKLMHQHFKCKTAVLKAKVTGTKQWNANWLRTQLPAGLYILFLNNNPWMKDSRFWLTIFFFFLHKENAATVFLQSVFTGSLKWLLTALLTRQPISWGANILSDPVYKILIQARFESYQAKMPCSKGCRTPGERVVFTFRTEIPAWIQLSRTQLDRIGAPLLTSIHG